MPKRGRKPAAKVNTDCGLSAELISDGIQMLFASMATATQHGHWMRQPQECLPTAIIAKRVLDRMARENPKMFERLSEKTDLGLLALAAGNLTIPSIIMEMEIRRNHAVPTVHAQPGNSGNGTGPSPNIPDVGAFN